MTIDPEPGSAVPPGTVVLAVDIGGTKIAAAVVDRDGRVGAVDQTPTPPLGDAEQVWGALVGVLDRVTAATGAPEVGGVGVGCGGPMSWPAGTVSPLNIPGWRDFPLRTRLQRRFPGVPVRVHNDAICVAVAEHWRGAGSGYANVLGMVVSTGVGGGVVLGGRLVDGGTGNAGHIGHVVVDPNGPPCVCGGRGCLEAIARGPAIVAWALEQGWAVPAAGGPDGVTLAAAARSGDPVAQAAFERAGTALGTAIASAATLLDLDVVVVAGGVAQTGPLLFDPARAAFDRHAGMAFARRTRITSPGPYGPAAGAATAGLLGAASLVLAGDRYWHGD